MPMQNDYNNEKTSLLWGGERLWWDHTEQAMVKAATAYVPFGCPDWGEKGGKRNDLCAFCAIPRAVEGFREMFYGGNAIGEKELANLFHKTLAAYMPADCHTLMIFNGGSFCAMPRGVQREIISMAADHSLVRRVVVESRAELITEQEIQWLAGILRQYGKQLTIRIGIETRDDHLRLQVLRKGHTRRQLARAVSVMKDHGVASGGYVLLNPAPGLDPAWAMQEALATIDWVLNDLCMDEAYFCSTNVGVGSTLERAWRAGKFAPASLWMVLATLIGAVRVHGKRIYLLPFQDEPPLLAVPSNHMQNGIPQDLTGAQGCDRAFHALLKQYRKTMDPAVLVPPSCVCRPKWFVQ